MVECPNLTEPSFPHNRFSFTEKCAIREFGIAISILGNGTKHNGMEEICYRTHHGGNVSIIMGNKFDLFRKVICNLGWGGGGRGERGGRAVRMEKATL